MASLTHLIHTLQSGDLSNEAFLDALDRTLAADDTGYAQLLEILGQEHTKAPLPQHVYAEVVRRIEHLAHQRNVPPDETRMLANRARLNFSHRTSPHPAEGFAGYE